MKEWREYTLNTSPIGKGMYSKVYYGVHRETGREIALKKIFFNKLENKIKDRVITEINILQRLNHTNIIKLYDYKFDGEYILLIMEYCNGGDLKKWMKSHNSNEEEILKVLRQIISSIDYLHKNGVMHRDIKPENIIFHNDEIKICDFGFSTLIKDNTELFDTMCGTPLYMSPEILFLQKYNIYSEIWSLGVLFYTILFKRHPFGELENIEDYRNKIREKFIIEFNEKDTEYKEESILKIIETTKNMLSYDYNNRPSIHHIHSFINNEISENNPYIGPILCNNFIDVNGRLVSPFGSYNSPVIGPANSPSSPVLFNPNNTPYRKSSSFDIFVSKRIEDLEEKVNKLETLVSYPKPNSMKEKDEQNIDMFELNEEYFYKKEEYEEEDILTNINNMSSMSISKPIKIKNSNQSNSSFVGTIYNFIAKSF